MQTEGPGSVTRCLFDLRVGIHQATVLLWERYFEQLVRLARSRLRSSRHRSAEADEEDVALSAFESFCEGTARGKFPDLAGRDDLWRLLVVITTRKAAAQLRRESRKKRGGDRFILEASTSPSDSPEDFELLDRIVGREPSPEFAAMVAEEFRNLLESLGEEPLRKVAISRMEGYSVEEIAGKLDCSRRTVARRLELIRKIWGESGH